jgi:hypothetical protein
MVNFSPRRTSLSFDDFTERIAEAIVVPSSSSIVVRKFSDMNTHFTARKRLQLCYILNDPEQWKEFQSSLRASCTIGVTNSSVKEKLGATLMQAAMTQRPRRTQIVDRQNCLSLKRSLSGSNHSLGQNDCCQREDSSSSYETLTML